MVSERTRMNLGEFAVRMSVTVSGWRSRIRWAVSIPGYRDRPNPDTFGGGRVVASLFSLLAGHLPGGKAAFGRAGPSSSPLSAVIG
jgi:hypothetical protein